MANGNGSSDRGTTQILVALIGALAVVGAAVAANWDKFSHQQSSTADHQDVPTDDKSTDKAGATTSKSDQAPHGLTRPTQLAPGNGSSFSTFPRTTELVWGSVPGAASYTVEVDCLGCCQAGSWCTDIGKSWNVQPGLKGSRYTFNWVGAQKGRWRVWAVDDAGTEGPKSGWFEFQYTV